MKTIKWQNGDIGFSFNNKVKATLFEDGSFRTTYDLELNEMAQVMTYLQNRWNQ